MWSERRKANSPRVCLRRACAPFSRKVFWLEFFVDTFLNSRYFHDDVGMVPYSFYERKPEFYDDVGKVTYKYFNQYKSIGGVGKDTKKQSDRPFASQQQQQQDQSFLYDVDGKVPYHTYYYPTDRPRFK